MSSCLAASASACSSHVVPVARAARRNSSAPRRSGRSGGASTSTSTSTTTSTRTRTQTQAVADPTEAADLQEMFEMRTYVYSELSAEERKEILKRPRVDFTSILGTVAPIVDAVAARGDAAVREFTSKFDKVDLDQVVVRVADLPDPELAPEIKVGQRKFFFGKICFGKSFGCRVRVEVCKCLAVYTS